MKLKANVPAETLIADLEELIPRRMEEAKVPGLSIALIRDAKPLWGQGFGVKSTLSNEPVTTDTVFSAQSLSKPVFAYAALKMCETGIIELDTSLTEYLPEPYILDEPRLKLITMRHVLSHTTGFPNWRATGHPLKMMFTPGEKFSYSGEGYVYLQRVMEHLCSQTLAEYMKANLLNPLGMYDSGYVWADAYELGAEGHNKEGKASGRPKWSRANAAASLYSTPTEFAMFMIEVIQSSKKDTFHLDEALMMEMLKPQVEVNDYISWGLGWGIQHSDSGDSFWQWGSGDGFQGFAVAFKEQGIGVVIMTNSSNGLEIGEEIVVQSIGGEHPAFSQFPWSMT